MTGAAALAAHAAHAAMLADLCRPGACGGQPGAAGLVETHISSLLLAGSRVCKLKKPVLLPFVDFSTLAVRHAACQQEQWLNRRTAPQWYVAVVPVCQRPAGATIAAPSQAQAGPVIDWAVQMQRFDGSQLFGHLADAGTLRADQVDALAGVVLAQQPQWAEWPGPDELSDTTVLDTRGTLAEVLGQVEALKP